MKKSSQISFVILVSLSSMLIGCGSETEYKNCVNKDKIIVDEKHCKDEEKKSYGSVGYVPYYHWLYTSQPHSAGSSLAGIPATTTSGKSAVSSGYGVRSSGASGAISRGGFGGRGGGIS